MPSTARIVILKLIQAGLLGGALYMQYNSMEFTNHGVMMLSCASLGGFLAVVLGMIGAVIVQQPVPKRADILYNLMGACALGAAGYFIVDYFYVAKDANLAEKIIGKINSGLSEETRNMGLAKGAVCFITAFVILIDIVATLRE
ncbi:uncharacterized protein LOC132202887 [Neocloeon triangulifer]|uniref:uncharacterized protein LOC132202887 n=1 Tax=Neocloeon triangulifer TaxID=2078957 RepID=UPI00286F6F20|nr:uncharacterized protein LOC132202887 [Neocloeon triangulifer]